MGRRPCCEKEGLNKGAWTAMEDMILTNYIALHGQGKWRDIPLNAGLKRCGKSCRLRWLNYLTPNIKRGNITPDEEDLIIRLHKILGNRWSLIAGRLPGRTDNEIKNYWNTKIRKRLRGDYKKHQLRFHDQNELRPRSSSLQLHAHHNEPPPPACVVHTKATRCTKVVISKEIQNEQFYEIPKTNNNIGVNEAVKPSLQDVFESGPTWALDDSHWSGMGLDQMEMDGPILSRVLGAKSWPFTFLRPSQGGGGLMSSPLPNDNLLSNKDVNDDMGTDWITSFLQSDFYLEISD